MLVNKTESEMVGINTLSYLKVCRQFQNEFELRFCIEIMLNFSKAGLGSEILQFQRSTEC